MKPCDIVLIGVGGQGVVTLGDLIASAALAAAVPVSYVPTKGMAQRGGFVKTEIRLGRTTAGPRIPERGGDLVVSMERSEALKGLRWIRPCGRFILYDHVWEPAGVMLGEDAYPSQASVFSALSEASSDVLVLNPGNRPSFHDRPVAANVFTLGAMFSTPILKDLIDPEVIVAVLIQRWPKAAEANRAAFDAGMAARDSSDSTLLGGSRSEGPTE
jgi:indolepyruvate ferredoxin oxidoreductase beta subunit